MPLFKFIPFVNIFRGKLRRKTLYMIMIVLLALHLCWHLNHDITHCYSEDDEMEPLDGCSYMQEIPIDRPIVGCTTDHKIIYKDEVRVLGTGLKKKGFLTIGLPTIERLYKNVTATYLERTLDNLMSALTLAEINEVHIVIFLADLNEQSRNNVKNMIASKYQTFIDTNFINVIEAPRRYYSKLKGLVRTFGDSQERMYWRSKQTLDYVYLFQYCEDISKYYMQIEDDVTTAKNFLSTIKRCIKNSKYDDYAYISTSIWGFIGKLFKNEELDYFARMLRIFYNDIPCDWLLNYYVRLRGDSSEQFERLCVHLFDHIGNQSSSLGT